MIEKRELPDISGIDQTSVALGSIRLSATRVEVKLCYQFGHDWSDGAVECRR
jgi:hypothetical protein